MAESHEQSIGKSAARSSSRRARKAKSRSGRRGKVLVIVHGGGVFPDDYYKPLVAAIEKQLGHPFNYVPVYYADLASQRVAGLSDSPEKTKFMTDLQNELAMSFESACADPTVLTSRAVDTAGLPVPIGQVTAIAKEVAGYLFDPGYGTRIQSRLIEKLSEAEDQYGEIVLASLSLGTLVSFDTLKLHADLYKISIWFTCGSPLGKLRRLGQYEDDLGAITTSRVAHWFNIYDTSDFVADPLGPFFPAPGYRLHDIFVDVGTGPMDSHDYFNNPESIQMFADALR